MDKERRKIGVALSGGGYRAAAYHIGTLRALNKLGVLNNVDVISSVSGGSITAAYYTLNKDCYESFEKSFIKKLQTGVMKCVWLLLAFTIVFIILISGVIGCAIYIKLSEIWLSVFISSLSFVCAVVYILLRWYNYMPISYIISKKYDKLFF